MLKQCWFQVHWLLGMTAGIVLAIVGVTGAMLSFEHELKYAINPGVMSVTPQASSALAPSDLIDRIQSVHSDRRIVSLSLSADPKAAARIVLAAKPGDTSKRGETHYLDPYTGALLGPPKGEEFFRLITQIHRWLAAGDTGKAIVGGSTIALIVLCLSGLYLRWPRQAQNWRAWLTWNLRHKGRSFLWDLHAVAGTWCLLLYLLAALTGLYWSYDWYRNALFSLTGAPRPAQQDKPKQAGNDGQPKRPQPIPNARATSMDVAAVWAGFQREVDYYQTMTVRLPERAGQPAQITYLDMQPAHDRANNRLLLDAQTGSLVKHERYADKPAGTKLMSSMFALHSGRFFGLPGTILMMVASLLMPLFAITGWMLYLDRRRKKRSLHVARAALAPASTIPSAGVPEWLIGFASQTGSAEQIAWQTAGTLRRSGAAVSVMPLSRISHEQLQGFKHALFVVSTFGDGEPPDHARSFLRMMPQSPALDSLRFGLLALGSRQYRAFCGFGHTLDNWLRRRGAQALFEPIEVDNGDQNALQDWQIRLGRLTGVQDMPAWADAPYTRWRLAERRLLNPGSVGGPTFKLVLEPPASVSAAWQAGDLVEIRVPNTNQPANALPTRQYSIASIPLDNSIHLLVRQVQHATGLGLASGWLTHDAPLGAEVELRIHSNPGFQLPDNDKPLILIGNGTGFAGLRGHMKARAQHQRKRNWLIFGERNIAHDFYCHEDIEDWQHQGVLERVDLAFSRDAPQCVYVQDRLRASAGMLRAWLGEGATILVCGSLDGMAPGVEAALIDTIGMDTLEDLRAEGRYRRDVY